MNIKDGEGKKEIKPSPNMLKKGGELLHPYYSQTIDFLFESGIKGLNLF